MGEENWNDFFIASMGAAAALAGLVCVSISINLKQILKFKSLPGRAAESLLMLTGAMLVSGVSLVPKQTFSIMGLEMLVIGGVVLAFSIITQVRAYGLMRHTPLSWWITRAITTLVTSVPIAAGGLLMLLGMDSGLSFVAFGILGSMAAGVQATWVLMVEILR